MAVLNKKQILKMGIVDKEEIDDIQFTPNGLDVTVKNIYKFSNQPGLIDFDNTKRNLPETVKLNPDEKEEYNLTPGVYLAELREYIKLPKNIIANIYPRSTLCRCGATTQSGAWDAGYFGSGAIQLIVNNPAGIIVAKKARIAQMIFIEMTDEAHEEYNGAYQGGKNRI
ncbi:MAG: hypothetical protein DRN66_02950 [Candidatus Nanohalarchaeota archaeon]|nr:MAG: hypothetical protein DRN66_02950 [Candidatus Nanohaloarchaeota archaeon]